MSKILCPAILDGYTRRKDRSVSLRFITQEKTSSEIMDIDATLDQFGILYFRGEEKMNPDEIEELDNIDLDVYDEPKSQSQRLRNVLYILWKQDGERGDFKKYYKQKTEEIIQHFKNKLDIENNNR
ncbi:MAG: hypothetical protein Tp172MES00d2C118481931_4 [Prokaryotic dsDNA virus sp.]|nr:MAG: hypothetical protein Tp172MES00d2C118481931_4 [Prokaryotic dsDNA virus sp.]|tara:strand:- start:1498 stop:1875 length:378 start_codon:yes stop_codon:yes gene_type:complete